MTLTVDFTDASAPFDTYVASVDWGDGTITSDPVISVPGVPTGVGSVTAEHTYLAAGVYDVVVTLTDGQGSPSATSIASVVVFDPNAAPVIIGVEAPLETLITDPVELSVRFDDASVPVEDLFGATIDWGDGDGAQTIPSVVAPTLDLLGTFSASRSYGTPGTYDVIVVVSDPAGNFDEERLTIEVVAPDGDPMIVGPVGGPSTPQAITEPVRISADFTDNTGSFDTYTATVDWGDGSPAAPANVEMLDGSTAGVISAERIYAEAGVYSVTVTISDNAGSFDAEVFEFVVVFDPETQGRVVWVWLLLVRSRGEGW